VFGSGQHNVDKINNEQLREENEGGHRVATVVVERVGVVLSGHPALQLVPRLLTLHADNPLDHLVLDEGLAQQDGGLGSALPAHCALLFRGQGGSVQRLDPLHRSVGSQDSAPEPPHALSLSASSVSLASAVPLALLEHLAGSRLQSAGRSVPGHAAALPPRTLSRFHCF